MDRYNFKNIRIGQMIEKKVTESGIEINRICNFIKCNEEKIKETYESESLDTEVLLRWSKLLEYDFFRFYTQHLILYAPPKSAIDKKIIEKSSLPQFRKNIYTKEIIDFILEMINTGQKTKLQIIEDYKIPKTTLYQWINKYNTLKT